MDRSESPLPVSLGRDPPTNLFAEVSEAALLMGPVRETVQDLAINQRFRRDVFCHGRDGLTRYELSGAFAGLPFHLLEASPQDSYTFVSSLGQINGNHALYKAVEASLADGPLPLAVQLQPMA